MKIIIGGIRGTNPVCDPAFSEFGGDTTSVLVETNDGSRVIIDMGTGLHHIDRYLHASKAPPKINIFMTHYHLDHLIGLPAFMPLYEESWTLRIAGPRLEGHSVKDAIHRMLERPFWPLQLNAMKADIEFIDLDPNKPIPFRVRSLAITWCPVHHPGNCIAYRITETTTGASLVFATDIEWNESTEKERAAFLDLCRRPSPASLLLFDGHFSPIMADTYRGWGHSSWENAVEIARASDIERLVVIHHSPDHADTMLNDIEKELRQVLPKACLGRAHQTIVV